MGMEQAPSATLPSSSTDPDAGLTLAGLIDVLDRADDVLVRRRPRPRRSAVYRSAGARPVGSRTVADRWDPMRTMQPRTATPSRPGGPRPVPLRSVQPAPTARPRLSSTPPRPAPAPAAPPAPPSSSVPRRLRDLLRGLTRRVALWGAGPDGAYLAWGGGAPRRPYRAGARPVDPPVVLRELPSTPTIPPAAPSPAAANRSAPVSPAPRPLLGRVPASFPGTPRTGATGLPETRARAPAGIRGSPGAPLARGSPPGWPDTG